MADVISQQELATENSPENALAFVIKRALEKLNVATLVQVAPGWTPPSGVAPVGFVDVTPLVSQVDGSGTSWPATTIWNVPYLRIQGGANAIICDPQPGDTGFCLFCDRDISSVKATGAVAAPASKRRFNFGDALYFGGWNLNTVPTSYVQVTPSAINIVNPTNVTVNAGSQINLEIGGTPVATATSALFTVLTNLLCEQGIQVLGNASGGSGTFNVSGIIQATGEVKSGTHTLTAHTHSGVQTGGGSTNTPTG
jgi:hypothetical protein